MYCVLVHLGINFAPENNIINLKRNNYECKKKSFYGELSRLSVDPFVPCSRSPYR